MDVVDGQAISGMDPMVVRSDRVRPDASASALIVLLFIAVPLAELYVILQVGDAIGAVPTILLLAADSVLGSVLLRSPGPGGLAPVQRGDGGRAGCPTARSDGVAVIFGGAFLITPGFLTDIVGLLLLLPPTRAVIRRLAARVIAGG